MSITMTCKCGKKLSVPDDAAGRRARCPACNAVVQVPGEAPEPPSTEPESMSASGKMDQVVNAFTEDLARSRERAPELTQVAIAVLVWAGLSLLLTFFAAIFAEEGSIVQWLVVYLPQSAVGGLLGLAMIKAWHRTPAAMAFAAPLLIGASYVTFWRWANSVRSWGALYFVIALVTLGGYLFLYWYIRQPGVVSVFPIHAEQTDETGAEKSAKG